jgi:hypothetical protein
MYEVDEYTVALLHFEDGLKDESGKVWTANGGAAACTILSKLGGSSLSLNGTNQYLVTPKTNDFDFGSGDFTIDCWIYPLTLTSSQCYCIFDTHYRGYNGIMFLIQENRIYIKTTIDGISWIQASAIIPAANTWYHVAAIRYGSKLYVSINGVLSFPSILNGSLVTGTAASAQIGQIPEGGSYFFNGYIDEFRISKGIARWTEHFNPEKPISSNKALLVVTMSDEIQKEYDLSMDEINAFITWYNTRATGTGLPHYIFNKDFNLGPFQSRKDYLVFDKIQNFEVMEY